MGSFSRLRWRAEAMRGHLLLPPLLILAFMGNPSEGTSIEFVGELLEHPIAKQLMVQERLVELAKKGIPRLLDKSEIFGLRDEFLAALIRAFPDIRPSIPDGAGPLGSSIFDDEEFLLSGIADIEYEYDYDTGEFLGLKEDNEETTVTPDSSETTTEVPAEDSTELSVTDNEVNVGDPRQPKALEEEEQEEFDPYKRVKVGCCWYAAIQIADNQKSRQPKSLGFENQSTLGGGQVLRGGRNLGGNRKRKRPRRRRKSRLPLDRVISSLNNLVNKGLKSLLVQNQPQKPPVARRPYHRPG